jgi:hypothetical protein
MLMNAALRDNTKRTYTSAQNRFINFCKHYKLLPLPVSEDTLLLYVSFLFEEGLSGSSIKVYLSAVRSLHIFAGKQYPTDLLRVRMAIKGAVRETPAPNRKLPITYTILSKIMQKVKSRFNGLVLCAAMSLAFFGCLRLGEVCVQDAGGFCSKKHLCLSDVTMDEKDKCMTIFLRRSKTDIDNTGVYVHVGCSGSACCAFCSMNDYLSLRRNDALPQSDNSPLFLLPGGKPLHKTYAVSATRLSLSLCGIKPENYSGHSFRAGAATTAGDKKFQDWEIKMLGRWASPTYNIYLRNPRHAASFASRLVDL